MKIEIIEHVKVFEVCIVAKEEIDEKKIVAAIFKSIRKIHPTCTISISTDNESPQN